MIGQRKFRIGQRLQERRGVVNSGMVLTDEDRANIEAFAEKLAEAVSLLRQEVEAIGLGQLSVVGDLYERKATLLKWLELRIPLVEPFLKHEAATESALPELLADFKQAIDEDSAILSRMASAAGTIVREIEKTAERHSLNGLYGKSGHKLSKTGEGRMRIDKAF